MPGARSNLDDELLLASRRIATDVRQSELSVPSMHCGACIQRVERVARPAAGRRPRAGQSLDPAGDGRLAGRQPPPLIGTLDEAGFDAHLGDAARAEGTAASRS